MPSQIQPLNRQCPKYKRGARGLGPVAISIALTLSTPGNTQGLRELGRETLPLRLIGFLKNTEFLSASFPQKKRLNVAKYLEPVTTKPGADRSIAPASSTSIESGANHPIATPPPHAAPNTTPSPPKPPNVRNTKHGEIPRPAAILP